jgi:mono/diheme cytochrome c family protein
MTHTPRLLLCALVLVPTVTRGQTGATLFHEKGCEHCHGVGGIGTDKGPDLRGVGRKLHKDQIEHQIQQGGENMPPFADAFDPTELKTITDYLAKQKAKPHR